MGQTASSQSLNADAKVSRGACPVKHDAPPSGCPVKHAPSTSTAPAAAAQCPISHESREQVNPLNQMPSLSQAPSASQRVALPTERTVSSIPRDPSAGDRWEYPSPQQFYNALMRKGRAQEGDEEHVEVMVAIHNFLNERAWGEVLDWERRDGAPAANPPHLARFMGRPGELSPKARMFMFAGWLLPQRFNSEPPFDRHDWIVRRATGQEVRYVIDYYSAPPLPDGSPVFALDVRPALDSVGAVRSRIGRATQDAWKTWRGENVGA